MSAPVMLDHDWFPHPLPRNVVIGERSWFYSSFAFVHSRSRRPVQLRVGTDTGIYNPSFFELGEQGEVEIGNFCALVGVTITTNSRVVIGDYAFISHDVIVADSVAAVPPGPHRQSDLAGEPASREASPRPEIITIGANSWIGARAVLLGGAHIGEGAIVGAATVVDFAVPPYSIAAGNPARVINKSK
ncbi:MAG TPA: acyltransferase [Gemmatimonadaceae bacterium]|nr:acyltransferase [Gemmatimonadaceae bacterium]